MMAASDKNKCVKCKNAIKDTEIVLVCGLWCRKTFHNECLGLSNREARAIICSKVRVKFHCGACEKRLAIELVGGKETQETKNLGNCVSLLDLVQKLVKLTNELSSDNSTINSKLDTVISSNARLEEYLLQSPKRFEKQNEETFDNGVGYTGRCSTKRMTEICDRNSYRNSQDRLINSERMCHESEFRQTEDNLQYIASDIPDGQQHEESVDNGVGYAGRYSTKSITEICERNNVTDSQDQILNNERMCRDSVFQQTEHSLHRIASDFPEQVADGQQQNFTESYSSNCLQEWGVPEDHGSTHDPLSIDEESLQQWKEPDGQDSTQDAPRFVKEECSPPEDFVMSGTFSIEKTEIAEDEEKRMMEVEGEKYSSSDFLQPSTLRTEETKNEEDEIVNENNFEELKHEVESTITGGEAESSTPVSVEADKINENSSGLATTVFLAARKGHEKQHTNKHEASCANKIGGRNLQHRNGKYKKPFGQMQDLKECTDMDRCEPVISCNLCHRTFVTIRNLKRHIRLHSGQRPYSCSICNKTFHQKSELTTHIRLHNGERPYNCSICNKTFARKFNLTQHIRVHTGERPYSCSICNKAFRYSSHIKNHIRVHTGERPYSCSICNKTFTQKGSLTSHIRVHTGERPYSCSICNKPFRCSSDFKDHSRVHTGERPYSCSICNKTFTHKGSLTSHIRLHTGERPYSCSICNKTFNSNSNFKNHICVHNGERPYCCSVCKKTFRRCSSFMLHFRLHKGERPHSVTFARS